MRNEKAIDSKYSVRDRGHIVEVVMVENGFPISCSKVAHPLPQNPPGGRTTVRV